MSRPLDCTRCGARFNTYHDNAVTKLKSLKLYKSYRYDLGRPLTRTHHLWCTDCTFSFLDWYRGGSLYGEPAVSERDRVPEPKRDQSPGSLEARGLVGSDGPDQVPEDDGSHG